MNDDVRIEDVIGATIQEASVVQDQEGAFCDVLRLAFTDGRVLTLSTRDTGQYCSWLWAEWSA